MKKATNKPVVSKFYKSLGLKVDPQTAPEFALAYTGAQKLASKVIDDFINDRTKGECEAELRDAFSALISANKEKGIKRSSGTPEYEALALLRNAVSKRFERMAKAEAKAEAEAERKALEALSLEERDSKAEAEEAEAKAEAEAEAEAKAEAEELSEEERKARIEALDQELLDDSIDELERLIKKAKKARDKEAISHIVGALEGLLKLAK